MRKGWICARDSAHSVGIGPAFLLRVHGKMIDSYNRNINYMRISVTDRCNLRCRYCLPKEGLSLLGHNDILRYEEILRIVRAAVKLGIEKVRITGGEPLVRKGLIGFMSILNGIEGLNDVSLTTNGILLADSAEGLMKAGMTRINISLDSLNEEKYSYITQGGRMADVLKGIGRARELGFSPIKINVVAMKGFNDDEILDFARLAMENPYEIRFIERMPFSEPVQNQRGEFLSADSIRAEIEKFYTLKCVNDEEANTDGPARMYYLSGGMGRIGFISPMSHHFCHSCNRLRLTADGHLRSCLFSDAETDLKTSLRAGCSDEEIASLLAASISCKPLENPMRTDMAALRKCVRPMQAIGG